MKPLASAAALLALLLLPGCTGYRLGSTLSRDLRTVHIPAVVNKTEEAFAENAAAIALRREIQKEGTLTLADEPNRADCVLEVALLSYELTPLAYDRTNRTRANEYRINTTASVVLRKTADAQVVVNIPALRADTNFEFSGDLVTARREAFPAAAEDLARDIVSAITEAWQD